MCVGFIAVFYLPVRQVLFYVLCMYNCTCRFIRQVSNFSSTWGGVLYSKFSYLHDIVRFALLCIVVKEAAKCRKTRDR